MENQLHVCPRPRNTRACDKCRARKVRCLPGKRSEASACQRCARFGHTCSYEGKAESTRNPKQDEDILSGLFASQPEVADVPNQVFDLHRRVFQSQMEGKCSSAATSDASKPLGPLHEPRDLFISVGERLTIDEAERLVSQFQYRKVYFPFIDLPEDASATWLARHRPFLLLAILTVNSSKTPRLQQRIDARLRQVLSEKVIFHGEQSLDYAQGLLIYIAWYPLHLRPLRNQFLQFMQIAKTMVSDLGLAHKSYDRDSLQTSLACYHLSSLPTSSINRRRIDSSAVNLPDMVALAEIESEEKTTLLLTKLQMLHREVSSHGSTIEPQKNITCIREAHEAVKTLHQKLSALDLAVSPRVQESVPFRLSKICLRVRIAFLPLQTLESTPNQQFDTHFLHAGIERFVSQCFWVVQEYLEALLSTTLDQYVYFSTREWSNTIMIFSICSKLCFSDFTCACVIELHAFQKQARAKMLIYLESLAHRMGNVSETPMPSSKHPDFFCMFKAVLEIMISTYVPPSSGSRDSDIAPGDFHVTQELSREPQDPEPETWTPGSNASRCPVLNGTLQDTDFWRALEQNDPVTEENVGGTTADLQGDGFGQRNEATTSDPWLEWPSILSDWVLDPDHVPT